MNLVDELHAVTGALREAGVVHAVCGGTMKRLAGRPQDLADLVALEALPDAT